MQQCCIMENILNEIRKRGGRITKTRKAIIKALLEAKCMLSPSEIASKIKPRPDRSTIYRELLFLYKNNIVIKSSCLNKSCFEIAKDHHHHLVCLKCSSFTKIPASGEITRKEEKIAKRNNFKIINHSLDFYGICRKCQKTI